MNQNNSEPNVLDEELDALLAEADASTEAVDESEAVITDDVADEIEVAANQAEMKAEAYADQPAGDDADLNTTAPAVTPAKVAKIRTPRVSRAGGAKPSDVVRSVLGTNLSKAALLVASDEESDETTDGVLSKIDAMAKKVASKAINLVRYRANREKLESYTRQGLDFLLSKGTVTSKDLVEHFKSSDGARAYSTGTARSQANQLMSLFPAVGIATKSGPRELTVNPDSLIVQELNAAATA